MIRTIALLLLSTLCAIAGDYKNPFEFIDPEPKYYKLTAGRLNCFRVAFHRFLERLGNSDRNGKRGII